ncbi:class I adenylate-forming enzyme family protein [Mycolicibacterium sp. XJ1819]
MAVSSIAPGDGAFTDELGAGIASYGPRPCMEFERRWYSGDEVATLINELIAELDHADVPADGLIGLVARNRLPHAAAIVGLVAARRSMAMIYSFQSPESVARDIEKLKPAAVIAERTDWSPAVLEAAKRCGSVGVALEASAPHAHVIVARRQVSGSATVATENSPSMHILTSGTTGPPKRMPIPLPVLQRAVLSANATPAGPDDPPDVVYWPFASIGVCQLIAAAYSGRRMVLLEKFSVDEWVRAVKTYAVKITAVQPPVIRMLLESDTAKEDLASLEYLFGGSGPLEADAREAFEKRFGIPVLWAYGATEFAGSVCGWTPEMYRKYGRAKRDSVGKPLPGTSVRVVDPDTGAELPPDARGYLQALIPLIGPDWIPTTDIASVDEDGFVTLHGRGDGAINRGGFKILPETVRRALLTHPAVRDACVVGVPDARLGHVPFAAVETVAGAAGPIEEQLKQLVRDSLPRHHVPVAVVIVDELPRNHAMKVKLRDVEALYRQGRAGEDAK